MPSVSSIDYSLPRIVHYEANRQNCSASFPTNKTVLQVAVLTRNNKVLKGRRKQILADRNIAQMLRAKGRVVSKSGT